MHAGTVMIPRPAVETRIDADTALPLGERVAVKLVQADPAKRRVRFELA
jgi:hypothetical protein